MEHPFNQEAKTLQFKQDFPVFLEICRLFFYFVTHQTPNNHLSWTFIVSANYFLTHFLQSKDNRLLVCPQLGCGRTRRPSVNVGGAG